MFLINVSIGLTGFIVLESFKITFNENLNERSKNILGADISVEGRFKLNDQKILEIKKLLKAEKVVTKLSLFSMVKTTKNSRLIYLSQFNKNFPFYGGMKLQSGRIVPGEILKSKHIWAYPEY